MSVPTPEAGLVISYAYLWQREHEQGREEGGKDRPCAIIVALLQADESYRVLVVPVTHAPPMVEAEAMEIPLAVKKRLGLDAERSWIVLTESNEFSWPGPDLRPIRGRSDGAMAYGMLPPTFFVELRRRFVEIERARRSRRVPRTE